MSFYEVLEKYRDFDFDGYFKNVTEPDVLRSLNKNKLDHMDVLNLLSPKATQHLEQMAQKAHRFRKLPAAPCTRQPPASH